jgi:hypothetical protein
MQPKLHFSQNVKACHFSMNHFSEWHVIIFGWFGGTFMLWMHKSWQFRLVSDQVSTCRLAKNTVQHKTQQHKTHNNQHEMPPPYPPAALPSPSMGRAVAPPTHGAEAAKVPKQGVRCRVCAQRGWFLCFGCRTETPWKSEIREGSWPYGQNLIKTHNNQPEIDNSSRRDIGERASGGWSVWGDVVPSFGWQLGQQQNDIKWITLRPKMAADWWGYTQQPTRNRRLEELIQERRFNRGWSFGGCNAIVLGGNSDQSNN